MLSRLCPGPGPAPVYWNLSPVLDTANLRLLLWITGAQWPLNRPPPAPVTRPVCAIALMTETVLNKSSISFWLLDHVTTHNIFIYLLLAMSWISTMIDYCLRIRPVSPSVIRLSGVRHCFWSSFYALYNVSWKSINSEPPLCLLLLFIRASSTFMLGPSGQLSMLDIGRCLSVWPFLALPSGAPPLIWYKRITAQQIPELRHSSPQTAGTLGPIRSESSFQEMWAARLPGPPNMAYRRLGALSWPLLLLHWPI